MVKLPFYDFLFVNILERFLVRFGYLSSEENMNEYFRHQNKRIVRFLLDSLASGFYLWFGLFWIGLFLGIRLPWYMHVLVMISLAWFNDTYLGWIPRRKKVEVRSFGRREKG